MRVETWVLVASAVGAYQMRGLTHMTGAQTIQIFNWTMKICLDRTMNVKYLELPLTFKLDMNKKKKKEQFSYKNGYKVLNEPN